MARAYTGRKYTGNQAGADDLSPIPANKGGAHAGISPSGGTIPAMEGTASDSGNPGTKVPWEGADATPMTGQVPPLKSL